jgi:alkylation response protein AidB-like acyl-CoA dehydrogenase
MLHGDEVWCQLFSEPAAGSDLAAIQTRARQNDDGSWTLNGQKVWTTNAQFASFGLLLARTDADVPKHKGLTMFIVPMDAQGVTVRGLRQISGEAEFNEVFFDDVRLEEDAVVGGVGNGWGTALTVLMFERLTIGFGSENFGSSARLTSTIAGDAAARSDSAIRQRLGEVLSELMAVRFNGYRALTMLQRGQIPGPEAGLAKVTMVNAAIAATDLGADVVGPDALSADSDWSYLISFLPGLKSAGGTEQILRNTVGERVLGLPPEPRLDKGVPFSELRAKEREALAS